MTEGDGEETNGGTGKRCIHIDFLVVHAVDECSEASSEVVLVTKTYLRFNGTLSYPRKMPGECVLRPFIYDWLRFGGWLCLRPYYGKSSL